MRCISPNHCYDGGKIRLYRFAAFFDVHEGGLTVVFIEDISDLLKSQTFDFC